MYRVAIVAVVLLLVVGCVGQDKVPAPDRHAAMFQLDVPLTSLKPGFYTCQVNVIDDAAGHFLFPRLALLVRQ